MMATALASGVSPIQGKYARVSWKDIRSSTPATNPASMKVDAQIYDLVTGTTPNSIQREFGSSYIAWLEDDWDGEGALPISTQVIANVNEFLFAIRDANMQPEIAPEADGYIQLEWYQSKNCLFSLSFGPSNILSYSGIFGEGRRVYGADEIREGVPDSIWDHIQRICAAPADRIGADL